MNSLTTNVAQAIADFKAIKAAIENEGVEVPAGTETSRYPELIAMIKNARKPIYGVSGLYQRSPALTRTDDAVGLDFVINSSSGAVDSDFDNLFPWNKTEIVQDAAGKFLKFPEMYFRVGADSNYRLTDVAVSEKPSGSGKWYKVEPFMYACYGGSLDANNKLKSVPGASRVAGRTISAMRGYASANGAGYHQLDLYHHTVLMFLWLIEFATKNSRSVMTGRLERITVATGGTDGVVTPSGYNTETAQMRYHFIEDFAGNHAEFLEGFYGSQSGADYVTADVSAFSDSTAGKSRLCYNHMPNGYIGAYGWDENNPFLSTPCNTVDEESEPVYMCAKFGKSNDNSPTAYVKYTSVDTSNSIAKFQQTGTDGYGNQIGSRLIKMV